MHVGEVSATRTVALHRVQGLATRTRAHRAVECHTPTSAHVSVSVN